VPLPLQTPTSTAPFRVQTYAEVPMTATNLAAQGRQKVTRLLPILFRSPLAISGDRINFTNIRG